MFQGIKITSNISSHYNNTFYFFFPLRSLFWLASFAWKDERWRRQRRHRRRHLRRRSSRWRRRWEKTKFFEFLIEPTKTFLKPPKKSFTQYFFQKMGHSRPLFLLFSSFQTNITIFTTNICEKLYKEQGCEPTTFRTWVYSHNH